MPFTLADVVPWGRTFEEYRAMFALTDADLDGRILGCGDGPAAFNAVATPRRVRVPYELQRAGSGMLRVGRALSHSRDMRPALASRLGRTTT